jgi:pimeloyl-ACP methyl ester carboxylesterase
MHDGHERDVRAQLRLTEDTWTRRQRLAVRGGPAASKISAMSDISHRIVDANGTRIHVAELGEGPLVLLVHGFPESWYSWRHQLPHLAEAGFHCAAIDVRGYGRSAKPTPIDAYRMTQHVADNLGVVEALGAETAVIIGHDWGAPIAAASAQLRPDVFRAVALLSVPFSPAGPTRPTDAFRAMGGTEEFYINYFQAPGRAEAEIEEDVRSWLVGFYVGASADAVRPEDGGTIATVPANGKLRDRVVIPEELPHWLTLDDVDFYVGEFERSGFTGALNRYRNVDRDWEDLRVFGRVPITVPSLFIGGDRDGPTIWGAPAMARFPTTMPELRGTHILDTCGHWVQQEKPAEVNALLADFLRGAS